MGIRQNLKREYTKLSCLPNLNMRHKARKRMDEIANELEIFSVNGKDFTLSGGVQITLFMINVLADGDRNRFINIEKTKSKNKGYPSESWIRSAKIIKRVEKQYGVRFNYDLNGLSVE